MKSLETFPVIERGGAHSREDGVLFSGIRLGELRPGAGNQRGEPKARD
ncbi:MAG TPA: hypothetical protein VKU19_34015 [Bryobacteraceae bacterium]|nr:hypothetical protein [Bryobacteraceae bacterium]